jgi:hypothetical protein
VISSSPKDRGHLPSSNPLLVPCSLHIPAFRHITVCHFCYSFYIHQNNTPSPICVSMHNSITDLFWLIPQINSVFQYYYSCLQFFYKPCFLTSLIGSVKYMKVLIFLFLCSHSLLNFLSLIKE